jgi:hypothetical protein
MARVVVKNGKLVRRAAPRMRWSHVEERQERSHGAPTLWPSGDEAARDRGRGHNEDGAFHDHSWTQQHWINAAQSARLLGRRPASCMERSCVRSHHSGHRCYSARHLVRPRRVKCGEDRAGQQPCTAYETSGRDRRLLFLSRAPRCPTGVARPGSENAHETYKFPGTAPE